MKITSELIEMPKIVFFDTSAIDPMYNNYSSMKEDFNFLKKWIEDDKIITFTNDIVVREVKKHITEEVSKKVENLNKTIASKEFAIISELSRYSGLFLKTDKESMIEDTFNGFNELLKILKVKILSNGKVAVKNILNDYFEGTPPFGSGNKKHEFPDAIMVQTLLKSFGKEDTVHIIAKDSDWENVCKINNNFMLYKNIRSFLNFLNKDNDIRDKTIQYITMNKTQNQILTKIKKFVEEIDFQIEGREWDRKGMESGHEYEEIQITRIEDVEFTIDTIEDIRSSLKDNTSVYAITLTLLCSANIVAECTFFDEESSIWDSEDKEFFYKQYGKVVETHEFLMPLRLRIQGFETDNDIKFSICEYQVIEATDFPLSELNNATLINREYIERYDEDEWYRGQVFSAERELQCPSCKKNIVVELISDGTECVSTHDRQMGAENEYSIEVRGKCPYCDEAYLVTGSVWEYPSLCLGDDQDIMIKKDK